MDMNRSVNPASLIKYTFVAFAALLPVFFLPLSWVGVLQSKVLVVSLLILCAAITWAYARYRDGTVVFPRNILATAAAALPFVYFLSAVFSGASPSSFVSGTGAQDTVATIVLLYAVFLLAALAFTNFIAAAGTLVRSLFVGTLVMMLLQVFHVLFPAVALGVLSAAAASVFGSWHEVGILGGLAIFFTVALWRTDILATYWRWIALAAALLSGLMLVVVNMADVWFVFGSLMLAYAGYSWLASQSGRVSWSTVVAAICIAAASFAAGAFATPLYENLPARLQVLQVEVRPSWEGTFAIGRESIDGIGSVLLGSGPNTFTQQWSLYKPVGVNATEFWNVDFSAGVGFIPTTFVTVGVLGLLAWTALLVSLLWTIRKFFLYAQDRVPPALFMTLAGGALYLAAFHILYVPTVSLSLLTFFIIGVLASAEGVRTWKLVIRPHQWHDSVRSVALALAILAVAVSSVWTMRATVSDVLVNRSAVVYSKNQDSESALWLLRAALAIYANNDRGHRAAVELGIIRLGELVVAGATTDQATAVLQVSLETTIQHGLAAVSIDSGDYQNWLALAGLYRDLAGAGVQGAYENAKAAYEKAAADNPQNPLPLVQMAQLYMAQNDIDSALLFLDRALALKPDFAAAYLLRSQTYAAKTDMGSAVRDASAVVQLAPEDPLGWYNLGALLYRGGSYEQAAQSLEKAVALRSDYADALLILGLTYDKMGRTDEALAALEHVAEANPSDADLSEMIENIRAGRAAKSDENTR